MMKKFSHLTRISLLLASFFAMDKLVAIVRQVVINRQFGLSAELDAFNAANNLPDLLYALISGGALSIAFIPVLSEVLSTSGRKDAWKLFSRITNLAFLVTARFLHCVCLAGRSTGRLEIGRGAGFQRHPAAAGGQSDASQPDRHPYLFDQWAGDGRTAGQPAFPFTGHGAHSL